MTGFLRSRPGPSFWVGVFLLLSISALIPGLSTQAASIIASLIRDRPVGEEDRALVNSLNQSVTLEPMPLADAAKWVMGKLK